MTHRIEPFDREPVPSRRGLRCLSAPDPRDRVRAVVDIALVGGSYVGKTQFAAAMVRTLRARAPELPTAEAESNRRAMHVVMGAASDSEQPERSNAAPAIPHYTFRVGVAALLDALPALARANVLLRTGRLRLPLGSLLIALAVAGASAWRLPLPLALLVGIALALSLVALVGRRVKVATESARSEGEVELVLWDPPGSLYRRDECGDTYDFFAHLVRRREHNRPPWRGYSFAPALVINPIDYGVDGRHHRASRLRELVPMFAALGREKPTAVVAISRWAVVAAACPSGSDKDGVVTAVIGGDQRVRLPREHLANDLVEAEDGAEHGVDYVHIRYDAAAAATADVSGDALEYSGECGGATFDQDGRRSVTELLARLALSSPVKTVIAPDAREPAPESVAPAAAVPVAEQPAVIYADHSYQPAHPDGMGGGYAPDADRARATLEAMTHALETEDRQ